MSKKSLIVTATAAGILGIGIGSVGATPAESEPVVKTKVETKTVTEEVEVEVEVEVTPTACIEALDQADEGFGLAGDFGGAASDVMGIAQEAFMAIANNDFATIDAIPGRMQEVNGTMDAINSQMSTVAPKYKSARDECRDAS